MIKKLVAALSVAICLLWPAQTFGAAIQSDPSRESITSFKSKITVGKDAMANVTEEIVYDMDGVAHHGLERLIPVSSALNDGKYINYDLKLLSVTQDGQSNAQSSVVQENSWYRIRIGDPDKTLTGIHKYTINYTYGPVVSSTSEGDVFDYNVFGTYWVLPAKLVQAEVTFPPGTTINDQLCYSGVQGSRSQDCTVAVNGQTISVEANQPLGPREGLSLQVLMPNGSFSAYTIKADQPASPPKAAGDYIAMGIVLFLVMAVLVAIGSMLLQLFKEKRAKKHQTIVPQYESPDSLSPAEVGLLIDKKFAGREIVATLVDLAIRGYVRIRETKPKRWFRKAEYEIDLLKPPAGLKDYEHKVLSIVFAPGQLSSTKFPATVPLTKNQSSRTVTAFTTLNKQVDKSLTKKDYFKADARFSLKHLKSATYIAIVAALVLSIAAAIVFKSFDFAETAIYGLVVGAAWFFKRERYTQLGYEQWAKVKGFEWFLTVTEKDRMKFENAPAKTPALFNKLLPYAIALGVEKKWAKQFENIDLSKNTDWYVGSYSGYTALALTDTLNSSFSSVVSSNVVPSGSGGSFGGGFSGGGGGGGGGGGW